MLGKVFKAYDVRATVPEPLTEAIAWQIGHGAADLILEEAEAAGRTDPLASTIVVGRDHRPTSPVMRDRLIEGMRARGASVIDLGIVDTSMVTFAINHLDCGGGVQVTASHNPLQYNGFKFSRAKGRPIGTGTGLELIRERAERADRSVLPWFDGGVQPRPTQRPHRESARERTARARRVDRAAAGARDNPAAAWRARAAHRYGGQRTRRRRRRCAGHA